MHIIIYNKRLIDRLRRNMFYYLFVFALFYAVLFMCNDMLCFYLNSQKKPCYIFGIEMNVNVMRCDTFFFGFDRVCKTRVKFKLPKLSYLLHTKQHSQLLFINLEDYILGLDLDL